MKGIAKRFILVSIYTLLFKTPPLVIEAQRTVTRTETSTLFSTVIVQQNFACAKLVNVTGACRRGRGGLLLDVPVVLTFNEELEHSIDEAFNQFVHQQFIPSRTLRVEGSPVAILPQRNIQNEAHIRYLSSNQSPSSSPTPYAIQSSQKLSARFIPGRNKIGAVGSQPEPRIYFSQINSVFNQLVNNLRPRPAVTVAVTNTIRLTQTTTVTAGSATASFFVMGCTPNPFSFALCTTTARSV